MPKSWIRTRLRDLGKTQNDLADALGLSPTAVSRLLRDRPIFDNELAPIAGVLEVDVPTLLEHLGIKAPPRPLKPLQFAGFIAAGGTVLAAAPDQEFAERAGAVRVPPELGDRKAWLIVDNRDLAPYDIGDILFTIPPPDGRIATFLTRECVCTLGDGRRLFRRLHKGAANSRAGLFTLVSRHGDVTHNVLLTEAEAIDYLRPASALPALP